MSAGDAGRLSEAEAAFWRASEAGEVERDRGGYCGRGWRDGYLAARQAPCACPPCPGRGNDGHRMTHCAECCWGTGVEADPDCPLHGAAACFARQAPPGGVEAVLAEIIHARLTPLAFGTPLDCNRTCDDGPCACSGVRRVLAVGTFPEHVDGLIADLAAALAPVLAADPVSDSCRCDFRRPHWHEQGLAAERAAGAREALEAAGQAVESLRKTNPVNGDGSNHALDRVLAGLDRIDGSDESARRGAESRRAEMRAEEDELYRRLDEMNRQRRAQSAEEDA